MAHGRKLVVVAVLVACLASLLLLRARDGPAARPARAGLREGESLVDLPPDAPEPGAARTEPAVLRGRVFGLGDAPVAKAEVFVAMPRTHDLVRTAEDGTYELSFERAGQYLVEAALTSEYAPCRAWVEVPAHGDPLPRDFRLEPAGTLYGEVTMGGFPVADAGVELHAQGATGAEELVRDTTVRDGYFSFPFAPPENVTLRVDASSDEGFLPEPRFVTYRGAPLNVGKLELVAYPSLRFRMRLPDGRVSITVRVLRRDQLRADPDARRHLPELWPEEHSRLVLAARKDVRPRLLFACRDDHGDPNADSEACPFYLVEREVELPVGQPRELEVVVRRGPIQVTSRLVDGLDRPQHARISLGTQEVSTAPDGTFTLVAPRGGLVTVWLTGWEVPGHGWFDLDPRSPEHALLLDVDDPAITRMDLDGCIVGLAVAPSFLAVEQDPQAPGNQTRARWWWRVQEPASRPVACLSYRIVPGAYKWKHWRSAGEVGAPSEGAITVKSAGFGILDLR
jgi:hypothetical protein